MAKTDFKSVDAYMAALPDDVRVVLERVRGAIRKAVPRAEEAISYQIPAFKLGGRTVLYFAAWKKHYSLYPAMPPLVAAFEDELAPYEVNDRGTIRFPLTAPVPVQLIARLARFRANELAGGAEAKGPAKRGAKNAAAKKPVTKKPVAKKPAAKKPAAKKGSLR
jgi:uncharacterized protein YdhG (YjbR/CyaY superfamily)